MARLTWTIATLVALCAASVLAGDFNFQCETSCALDQAAPTAGKKTTLDFSFLCATTCQLITAGQAVTSHAATRAAFLELSAFASPQSPAKVVETPVAQDVKKDCYRICLNPEQNKNCQRAAQHAVLLQIGEMSEAELLSSLEPHLETKAGEGGDCLATCVRVCTDSKLL